MQNTSALTLYPAFAAYAAASLLLVVNLLFLWAWSGVTRGRTKTAINPEDAARFQAQLRDSDPPEVARVLRAHRNAEATIYPFLLVGLAYVLAGAAATCALVLFGIFTAARWVHSWAYLGGRQPLRTISFIVGGLALIAMMLDLARLLLRAA